VACEFQAGCLDLEVLWPADTTGGPWLTATAFGKYACGRPLRMGRAKGVACGLLRPVVVLVSMLADTTGGPWSTARGQVSADGPGQRTERVSLPSRPRLERLMGTRLCKNTRREEISFP
jgi:hypothetical protein